MMKNVVMIIIGFISFTCFGQDDTKAKKILDDFSSKTKAFGGMHIEFAFTLDNRKENTVETQEGNLYLNDNKYKLTLPELKTVKYFDGNKVWFLNKEVDEVTVEFPEEGSGEENLLSNPALLFDSYSEKYKYQFVKEYTLENVVLFDIELYPKDLKSSIARIKLNIKKENLKLHSAQLFGKDGIIYTFYVKKFVGNMDLSQSFFQFDPAKNPDVEVIDLTE